MRRRLAARLQGATVGPFPSGEAPPQGCDAVVLLESRLSDAGLIRRCLGAGRHVLLVAYPWLTADALDGLAAAAPRAGTQLAVLNPDRFLPSRQVIRQQLDAGRIGEPGLVRSHRWEHAAPAGGAEMASEMEGEAELESGAKTEREAELESAGDPASLGTAGGMAGMARDLDVALWLMGTAPNLVYALEQVSPVNLDTDARDRTSGHAMQVHLGFPGGGMALIDYAGTLPPGDGYQALSVIGSTGAAYADDHQNMQLVYSGGCPRAVGVGEGGKELLALVQAFVSGLSQGDDLSASAAAWKTAMAVVAAAQGSAARGQAVPLEAITMEGV
ncbi:MAG: hypothetical protein M3442_16465 [Chloroflexota bacterium]|nr:hypothetical protein [Chloroflexota bacterium]